MHNHGIRLRRVGFDLRLTILHRHGEGRGDIALRVGDFNRLALAVRQLVDVQLHAVQIVVIRAVVMRAKRQHRAGTHHQRQGHEVVIAILTERGEMWEQYNQYKPIHKQLAKVKPEKREQFEQRHSRELILYDAAARYLKELKDSGEAITPKAWQREIDQLIAGKQTDTLAMKAMREDLKAVERLRKTAEQLSRQERDKSHDREPER